MVHVGKLGVKEADLLGFEDVFSQFRTLGGELSLLAMDSLRYLGDSARILNPSLIEFNDKKFMTLRAEGHSGRRKYYTETFLAEVDSNYSIHNPYSLIENAVRPHEDARLAIRNGALFVSYVTDISHLSQGNGYRACMEVSPFEIGERIKNPIRPDIGDNKSHVGFQKNWLYFEKDESFLVIYNIDPLEVWDCTKSLENPLLVCKKNQVMKDWKYGHVRSSTTPIYLKEYDLWLVFFHSHLETQDKVRNYFLGALTFDNNFNITSYTDKPILVSTPHIQRSLSANTILPYGCIREDDDLILSLGINDSKAAIGRLPVTRVMELLKAV